MPTRSTQIALSAAITGMTLSDPVLDTKGNVLLPEGTVLTTALVASLTRHEIETVGICMDAASQADADIERDRQISRVERLFRAAGRVNAGAGDGMQPAVTQTLHQLVLNFRSGMSS